MGSAISQCCSPLQKQQIKDVANKSNSTIKKKIKIKLTDFSIEGKLGQGAFGVVYLGQLKSNIEKNIQVYYAIKCVSKQLIHTKNIIKQAKYEKQISMFDCQFLVSLIMSFQDQQTLYYVQQYAVGGDTHNLIKPNTNKFQDFKMLGENGLRFIAGCVVIGIQFIHQRNYMYRDLKPENVLLFDDGYIKLSDFGLACQHQEEKQTKTLVGTIFYCSPEMVLKKGYNKMVDFWAFGVYLYEMSNFCTPFQKNEITAKDFQSICLEAQRNRKWKNLNLSEELKDLINNLLIFDPEERIGNKGWQQIKNHSFFKDFDWESLENRTMKSPLLEILKKYPPQYLIPQSPLGKKKGSVVSMQAQRVQGWSFYGNYADQQQNFHSH